MNPIARLTGLIVLSAFLLSTPQSGTAANDAGESAEAKKVVEDYFNALNNGQLEIIVGLYHKDSVFLPRNAPAARGIAEITKAYRALFERAKLKTEHVYRHVAVYGAVAIVESQGSGTLTLFDGNQVLPSNNKELFVLRKLGRQWKIDRYMFNDG